MLAYQHVQISPISCNVVGSILHVLGKNTDTAIVSVTQVTVTGDCLAGACTGACAGECSTRRLRGRSCKLWLSSKPCGYHGIALGGCCDMDDCLDSSCRESIDSSSSSMSGSCSVGAVLAAPSMPLKHHGSEVPGIVK